METTRPAGPPTCVRGHAIAATCTLDEARTLNVLVLYCETCDEHWEASPEERDVFLRYLERRAGDAVPP